MASLIVLNWKLYPSLSDVLVLAPQIKNMAALTRNAEIVICPPAAFLHPLFEEIRHQTESLKLGAQDISAFPEGAMTGDVGVGTVKPWAKYVIVGHSERRRHYQESDQLVSEKAKLALLNRITPIICVGEAQKAAAARSFVKDELEKSLVLLSPKERQEVVIAYEPSWAIGSTEAAPIEYAQEMLKVLKEVLPASVRVLYGGTVTEENSQQFLMAGFDGLLIGRASLKINSLKKILGF